MKKNIFQQINEIVKTKFFKIIVAVVILGIVFYMNFDVKRIDKDKLSNFIKKDKTISKNITDIIDASHETMVQPKESENTTVKKQLIPDSLIKKDIKKEEKLKTITNVFLKLKKIEDNYQRRVENNQINKDKTAIPAFMLADADMRIIEKNGTLDYWYNNFVNGD